MSTAPKALRASSRNRASAARKALRSSIEWTAAWLMGPAPRGSGPISDQPNLGSMGCKGPDRPRGVLVGRPRGPEPPLAVAVAAMGRAGREPGPAIGQDPVLAGEGDQPAR